VKTLAAAAAVLLLAGCTQAAADEKPAAPEETPASAAAKPACAPQVRTDALPTWARGGFNGDGSGLEHVLGDQGEIIAILFGAPLSSPPDEDRNNKILWVSKQRVEMGDQLKIAATLDGTAVRAEDKVDGGPGPSIIDLPQPGCWRLTLSWSGRTDTLDLVYR
jgi:hypothetical protein